MNSQIFFERLNLKNFRCYDDSQIGPFQKFNLIYGRNGSGKTSLLEALEIALTGRTSRIQGHAKIQKVVARLPGLPVNIGIVGSSAESVGMFRFWQFAKCMI